jgi:hypothetical protein
MVYAQHVDDQFSASFSEAIGVTPGTGFRSVEGREKAASGRLMSVGIWESTR